MLPRIDMHTHILPENMPDWNKRYGYGNFIRLEHCSHDKANMFKGDEFFREVESNCYRANPRIDDMNRTGVTVQVLSTVPVMFSYNAKPRDCLDLSQFLNDHIATLCRQQPHRFTGLGTVPMQSAEDAIPELRRCMNELGLRGIEIGTHINGMALSDPSFWPIWEEAERLDAAIFVHPWEMKGVGVDKYWLPWLVEMPAETSHAICSLIFSGVMERFPRLKFCFAHGGGSFPGTVGRVQHGHDCRPDLCAVDNPVPPRSYLGKFWTDSLVHDEHALRLLCKVIGENRICLGSDYPFPLGEWEPGKLIDEMPDFDEDLKTKLLWHNGLDFLGLDEKQFLIKE